MQQQTTRKVIAPDMYTLNAYARLQTTYTYVPYVTFMLYQLWVIGWRTFPMCCYTVTIKQYTKHYTNSMHMILM
jgi:hypothetical protein